MSTATTPAAGERWVALIGNPNVGKSTLFNALTGGSAKTGNYPGVTVERTVGTLRGARRGVVRLLDLPGTYSLAARSPDEMVAVDVLLGRRSDTPRPHAVVIVLDAANLQRNLYLATQVIELGLPTVLAVNLMDDAARRAIAPDLGALAQALGVPAVGTVALKGEGVEALAQALERALDAGPAVPRWTWPEAFTQAEGALARALPTLTPFEVRRALLDVGGEAERRALALGGPAAADELAEARARLAQAGLGVGLEAGVRYGFLAPVMARVAPRPAAPPRTFSDRLDAVLTHRVLGLVLLAALMTVVFVALFAWAEPLMGLIEEGLFGPLKEWVSGLAWPDGNLTKSLLVDGVIGGVGGVLVFLPQILILFGFLALLEGCGYMARAAFLMDRVLRGVGLSGRSFLPMLSSFACAVPGVLATRTIESRRDRIATIVTAPLMSCSARIPVYVLLIAAFVPDRTVLGFLNVQGLTFAAMYFVGILVAVPVAWGLKRTVLKGDTPSFLVELPPYRIPQVRAVLREMLKAGREFVVRAGTLILAASIIVWALGTFPRHPDPGAKGREALARFDAETQAQAEPRKIERMRQEQAVEAAVAQGEPLAGAARAAFARFEEAERHADAERARARDALASEADLRASGEARRHSALGRMGHAVEPVFEPIGWDWRVGMAVIASFPAREVVVGTLGVIYDLGEEQDEESEPLRERLKAATWESGPRTGQPVFDLASALALMVFFALCAQCVSTLVVIRRETGSRGWALFTFVYMTVLAWLGAWLTAVVVRSLA